MVLRIKSTHPESQGAYVLIDEADFDPAVHTLYRPDDVVQTEVVVIPDDWRSLHWKQRVALAEKLNGSADLVPADGQSKTEAADAVIAAEVERRA